jgi:hypothetical protein
VLRINSVRIRPSGAGAVRRLRKPASSSASRLGSTLALTTVRMRWFMLFLAIQAIVLFSPIALRSINPIDNTD